MTAQTGENGRLVNGRFSAGNKIGQGNPYNRRIAELRLAVLRKIKDQDVEEVLFALMQKAKDGDVPAAKLFLQYTIGNPEIIPEVPNDNEALEDHDFSKIPPENMAKIRELIRNKV